MGFNVQVDQLTADTGATDGDGNITIWGENNAQMDDTLTAGAGATGMIDITAVEGMAMQTAGDMLAGGNVTIDGGQGVDLDGTIGAGAAIGIGHPHWETLKILDTYRHQLKNDFGMVPVSKLVK